MYNFVLISFDNGVVNNHDIEAKQEYGLSLYIPLRILGWLSSKSVS